MNINNEIQKYVNDNDVAIIVKAKDASVENGVLLHLMPKIDFSKLDVSADKTVEENMAEVYEIAPRIMSSIVPTFNKKNRSFEIVVLPNPYFKEVLLCNENIPGLQEYVFDMYNKNGDKRESIFFKPSTIEFLKSKN